MEFRNMTDKEFKPDSFQELIPIHFVNIILGATCAFINIILIMMLVGYKSLRHNYRLHLVLAVGDFCNCLAIMLLGTTRYEIYMVALEKRVVPVETSWSCAIQPNMWLRLIGNLLPPFVQFLLGLEKYLGVMCPIWFKSHESKRQNMMLFSSFSFTIFWMTMAFAIAYINETDGLVKYNCGRKATYTDAFASFMYANIFVGYFSGFILTAIAFGILLPSLRAEGRFRTNVNLTLIVCFSSTILVALPNIISFLDALVVKIDNAFSEQTNWAAAFNSAMNIFVYTAVSREFRSHVLYTVSLGRCRGAQVPGTTTPGIKPFTVPHSVERRVSFVPARVYRGLVSTK